MLKFYGRGVDDSVRDVLATMDLGGHRMICVIGGETRYSDNREYEGGVCGMTLGAVVSGGVVRVKYWGVVEGPWGWTPGARLYLGEGGLLTEVLPEWPARYLKVVGIAESGTRVHLVNEVAIYLGG